MSLLEGLIYSFLFLMLYYSENKRYRLYLSIASLLVLFSHAMIEMLKWQFILIYLMSIALLLYCTRHTYLGKKSFCVQQDRLNSFYFTSFASQ